MAVFECWLLPLYYTDKRKYKTKNCLDTLNQIMKRKDGIVIDEKHKNIDIYENISKKYCKHKVLMKHYQDNPSLKVFIQEIQKRKINP